MGERRAPDASSKELGQCLSISHPEQWDSRNCLGASGFRVCLWAPRTMEGLTSAVSALQSLSRYLHVGIHPPTLQHLGPS